MSDYTKRNLNVEILRGLAMFMVLLLHANFLSFKTPIPDEVAEPGGILRVLLQSLCVVAVNVFVMISGWFGIRPSIKGLFNFLWQVFYFVVLVCLVEILVFHVPFYKSMISQSIGLYQGGGWFVASYLGLYILSPVLNSFVKTASLKSIWTVLLAFFVFEFLWGNTNSVKFVGGGYSTFSFIGIYILAGTLRRMNIRISENKCFWIIAGCTVIDSFAFVLFQKFKIVVFRDMILNYINPLVIIQSAAFILLFARKEKVWQSHPIKRRIILWFSSSCFAVYLLHCCNDDSLKIFKQFIKGIYDAYPDIIGVGLIFLALVGIFLTAVVLDKPRRLIWGKIISPLFKR